MSTIKRAWRFDAKDQMSASNSVYEVNGFNGKLFMDFVGVLDGDDSIAEDGATLISVTPSSGLAISALSILDDHTTVQMTGVATVAGSYNVVIEVETEAGQIITRRGVAVVESVTGT